MLNLSKYCGIIVKIGGLAQMKSDKKKLSFFSLEMLGMLLVLFAILSCICVFGGFGEIGAYIRGFLCGVFGVTSFILVTFLAFFGVLSVAGVKVKKGKNFNKKFLLFLLFLISFLSILHLAFNSFSGSYSGYVKSTYGQGFKNNPFNTTVGGVFLSLITGALASVVGVVLTYVIFTFLSITALYFLFHKKDKTEKFKKQKINENNGVNYQLPFGSNQYKQTNVGGYSYDFPFQRNKTYSANTNINVNNNFNNNQNTSILDRIENAKSLKGTYQEDYSNDNYNPYITENDFDVSTNNGVSGEISREDRYGFVGNPYETSNLDETNVNPQLFTPTVSNDDKSNSFTQSFDNTSSNTNVVEDYGFVPNSNVLDVTSVTHIAENPLVNMEIKEENTTFTFEEDDEQESFEEVEVKEEKDFNQDLVGYKFTTFSTSDLTDYRKDEDEEDLQNFFDFCTHTILDVIKKMCNLDMEIAGIQHGPTFTRFDLPIPVGVRKGKITSLLEDLALQLHAEGQVRIASVEQSSCIGIEVPNRVRSTVGLKELLESKEFEEAKPEKIPFVIGQDVAGRPIYLNLADLTHIMIGGTSGSGKSVFIRSVLISMMYKCSPKDLRLVICDPKGVDFTPFNKMPHMLIQDIINEKNHIVRVLEWFVKEMARRYDKLKEYSVPNLAEFNRVVPEEERMPRLILFIDEFADLACGDKNILTKVQLLAQKARAAGIHLIVAMQRPSVEVINGDIKVNFSTRISLKMQTLVDSKTIISEGGAEHLKNHGDMLFSTPDIPITRAQGPFIAEDELYRIASFLKANNRLIFDDNLLEYVTKNSSSSSSSFSTSSGSEDSSGGDDDRDYDVQKQALRYVITTQNASISSLQRRLGIGFTRAGRVFDWMVQKGYVGNSLEGNKRQIKITKEDFFKIYKEPV